MKFETFYSYLLILSGSDTSSSSASSPINHLLKLILFFALTAYLQLIIRRKSFLVYN